MNLAQCLASFNQADLYVVITEAFCAGRRPLEVLEGVLAAGVRIVQLREKDLEDRRLYELASRGRRPRLASHLCGLGGGCGGRAGM